MILYIVIAPSGQDLPVADHDYLWMHGVYYEKHASQTNPDYHCRDQDYLPIQDLATSATISTITDNRGSVSEFVA
jgi:hypothetical protein